MTDRFDALADRLAERVVSAIAELLEDRDATPAPLLDANGAARYLGVDRETVYAMVRSDRLPAIKPGDSERPRLRFDPRVLAEYPAAELPRKSRTDSRG